MPLHLLPKKSWNPYSAKNIERVRRDEAAAKAKEDAEEQRMQEEDAARRLAILRGETPPPISAAPENEDDDDNSHARDDSPRESSRFESQRPRKRKRPGEDDTDWELRLARDKISRGGAEQALPKSSSAPLVNRDGHIELFVDEKAQAHKAGAGREPAKKQEGEKDQYGMRLSDAAGKSGLESPWYAASQGGAGPGESGKMLKDVWGNDDPRRKQREEGRLQAADPLMMMRKGTSQLKDVKRARENLRRSREEELRQLRKEQRRQEKLERREERRRGRDEEPKSSRDRFHDGEDRKRKDDGRSRRRRRSASPQSQRSPRRRDGENRRRRYS